MRKEMQVVQVQINEVESAVKASSALHEKLDELIAFVGAHPHFQKQQEPSKVAQGSQQAMGGKGRKAMKNMMPMELHLELLQELVRAQNKRGVYW